VHAAHAEGSPKKTSFQMITLIALSRLTAMKANQTTKKKGTTMNSLTQFKKIRIVPLLVLAVLAVASPGIARGDTVLDWNDHAANAIVAVAAMPPPRGLIRLAMVHVAIYDAVNGIEGYPFKPYAVTPNVVTPASPEAATAAAAHDMLVALFPGQQADLDAKYAASLAPIPDGPAKTNGISVGQQAAAGILLFRANDGRDAVVPYVPGSGPGVWIPTPPGFLAAQAPEVAYVRPSR
jgi:hypothetical protein